MFIKRHALKRRDLKEVLKINVNSERTCRSRDIRHTQFEHPLNLNPFLCWTQLKLYYMSSFGGVGCFKAFHTICYTINIDIKLSPLKANHCLLMVPSLTQHSIFSSSKNFCLSHILQWGGPPKAQSDIFAFWDF